MGTFDPTDSSTWPLGPDYGDGLTVVPRSKLNGNGSHDDAPATDLFQRWTPSQLLESDLTLRWAVRGVLCDPTYGQIAGELKSLKSYLSAFLMLAISTGKPLFDRWAIDRQGPVVAYVGEGGRIPFTRRLVRIARAMGVSLTDADLHATFDVAPIGSPRFVESLERDLTELDPVLAVLDPLYAYHGATTNAANLHEEGALLSSLSAPCMANGTSLQVVNHFNQTGTGTGLKRITQSGSGEWVDSWILTAHRKAPDVDAGQFYLVLDIGSRQWGGTTWDLDLSIGRFDPDTGTHDGDIEWDLRPHDPTDNDDAENRRDRKAQERADMILDVLNDHPWEHTKSDILDKVGGKRTDTSVVFDKLASTGRIRFRCLPRDEKNGSRNRDLWGRTDQLAPDEISDPFPTEGTSRNGKGPRA